MCPNCWKSSEKVIDSATTIIVTPLSIKNQWISEFKRHLADPNFKVLSYQGISNGWISPDDLAQYDCIVTDFNTLSKELYFAETIDRQLRTAKKFEYPPSPLIHVKFFRVILDEAQMVENKNTRPSKMVKQLPAVNRWCTTGTPIEKGAIHYLYGLLYFLDVHPYDNYEVFNNLWLEYRNGYPKRLIEILSKIMWRTCKKDVEHEIQIPEQKEVIHYVEMSDLQKCYYQQVHNSTKPEFLRHVQNFLLRNSREYDPITKEKLIDYTLMDRKIYDLDNATLKTIMEPLRKLRQDCTIANLYINNNDQTRVKQTLRAVSHHIHYSLITF
jgi:E3 ubiquitin-protein ligase SHPRH